MTLYRNKTGRFVSSAPKAISGNLLVQSCAVHSPRPYGAHTHEAERTLAGIGHFQVY